MTSVSRANTRLVWTLTKYGSMRLYTATVPGTTATIEIFKACQGWLVIIVIDNIIVLRRSFPGVLAAKRAVEALCRS